MTLTSLAGKGFFLIHDQPGSSMAFQGKKGLNKTPIRLLFVSNSFQKGLKADGILSNP